MRGTGHTIASTTPTDDKGQPTEPGAINGGMFERTSDLAVPVFTIAVDDIDKALATVESLGGSTVRTKVDVMGMGFAAYFKDTEGNVLGLWQNAG